MSCPPSTRREFLSVSTGMFGASWLWVNLPVFAALSGCARDAARIDTPFRIFTGDEGATMRALAARLIPSGFGMPGAEEAGAVWFIDGALDGPFSELKGPILSGLADLDQRTEAKHGVAFADSNPEQQDAIIGDVAGTPFFDIARMLTVAGVFSDPRYGGNRDHAGEVLLGVRHAPSYQPPFGWYDAEYGKGGSA